MWLSQLKDEDITPDLIRKLIFDPVTDGTGEKADCILVLGGSAPFADRVPKAVELYRAGLARKIVVSGAPVWDTPYGRLSEADAMAACAISLGVPEEDIIRDNLATTTVENMICGALAIGRAMKFTHAKKLLLVTSWYHMQRAKRIADRFLPPHFQCICCPAPGFIGPDDDWKSDPDKQRRVIREVQLTRDMILKGYFEDFEI